MSTLNVERFKALPGERYHLTSIDSNDSGLDSDGSRADIEEATANDLSRMRVLQERLFAERRRALLIVLLATDSGGKDSTTRRIFSGVNPTGCTAVGFTRPTEQELRHDFLWRIHKHVPEHGNIGIFIRSHYEDVTVPRVSRAIDRDEVLRRYDHIRAFESLLIDSGVTIRKFHLSISRDEQAERLQGRLDDPSKHWKFDPADLEDRERWYDFQGAFEEAINATTTDDSPWYIVPANRKWFRDAVVARVVVETLEHMNPQYPGLVPGLDELEIV
jgi:PPK2 family polyphosphate:nucleotide phosphotransferase